MASDLIAKDRYTALVGNHEWALSVARVGADIPGFEDLKPAPRGTFYRLMPVWVGKTKYSDLFWSLELVNSKNGHHVAETSVFEHDGKIVVRDFDSNVLLYRAKARKQIAKDTARRRKRESKRLYEYERTPDSPRGKTLTWRRAVLSVVEYFLTWGALYAGLQLVVLAFYLLGGDPDPFRDIPRIAFGIGVYALAAIFVQRGVVIREEGLSMKRALGPIWSFFVDVSGALKVAWYAVKDAIVGVPAAFISIWKTLVRR